MVIYINNAKGNKDKQYKNRENNSTKTGKSIRESTTVKVQKINSTKTGKKEI